MALIQRWSREAKQNVKELFQLRETAILTPDQKDTAVTGHGKSGSSTDLKSNRADGVVVGISRPHNPIRLLRQLSGSQWVTFVVAFVAMFADYFDFYALAVQTKILAAFYHTSKATMSSAITYTMLTRGIGGITFGILGDMMGRKWPLVLNCVLLGALQMGSIYCKSLGSFLAVRCLFGIGMGGIWGNAAASLLEMCPPEAKGILSGMLSSSLSFAYITAACANMAVGDHPDSWKTIFWAGVGLSFGAGLIRAVTPESRQFIEARAHKKRVEAESALQEGLDSSQACIGKMALTQRNVRKFFREMKLMLKDHWGMFIYCTVLLALFGWKGHVYTDNYTTFLLSDKLFNNTDASKGSMIMKSGGAIGTLLGGWSSEFIGRRRMMVLCALLTAILVPAGILPNSLTALATSGFFVSMALQSGVGCLAIYLNEVSPMAFRSVLSSSVWQVGQMAAAPAAEVVNTIAEDHKHRNRGKMVEAYGPTMGIMVGVLALMVAFWVAIGPERRGIHFEDFVPAAIELDDSILGGSEVDEAEKKDKNTELVVTTLDHNHS